MKEIALLNIRTERPTHFDFILFLYLSIKQRIKNDDRRLNGRKWREGKKRMEMAKEKKTKL